METDQVKKEMMRLAALEKEKSSADQNHMSRTAALAANAFQIAMKRKSMSFPAFTIRQIRYTGRYVWIWQGLLLILILSVFNQTAGWITLKDPESDLFLYRRVPLFLCSAGLLSAWSCVPFFARSGIWKMTEVENASASLARLRTAQLIITGMSAILMELMVAVGAHIFWTVDLTGLAAWLFLPFLMAWNLILFLIDKKPGKYFIVINSVFMGTGFFFFALVWKCINQGADGTQDYMVTSGYAWILCGAAALLWILQIQKLGRRMTNGIMYK